MTESAPKHHIPNEPPPVIDGFEIHECLNSGHTSSIWKAQQISLKRWVIIKVLNTHFSRDAKDFQTFRREALLAANLKHSSIVQVYDFGQVPSDNRYYFVMEYISGSSVANWLKHKTKLPENDSLLIVHSVASALRYAWETSQLIHCHVKPANIMIDGDGTVKLTDLGLAQVVTSVTDPAKPKEDYITGTPNYMAPEQVQGNPSLDCRCDIYALGMTLYHMLTGKLPFDAPPQEVIRKQLVEGLPPPQQIDPAISDDTASFVMRMTAKQPAQRFQTWDEVLKVITTLKHWEPETIPTSIKLKKTQSNLKQSVCPKCKTETRQGAKFCRNCGHSLTLAAKPVPKAAVKPKQKKSWSEDHKTAQANSSKAPKVAAVKRGRSSLRSKIGANIRLLFSLAIIAFIVHTFFQARKDPRYLPLLRARTVNAWRDNKARVIKWTKELLEAPTQKPPQTPQPASKKTSQTPQPGRQETAGPTTPSPARPAPQTYTPPKPKPESHLTTISHGSLPKIDEPISIEFKNNTTRQGVLRKISKTGVTIQMEAGQILIPYEVMNPEFRARVFPETITSRLP